MTQARIGIGYSNEEWHPVVRRCRQALHQDIKIRLLLLRVRSIRMFSA
jgi:hypothetical protein